MDIASERTASALLHLHSWEEEKVEEVTLEHNETSFIYSSFRAGRTEGEPFTRPQIDGLPNHSVPLHQPGRGPHTKEKPLGI